MRGERERGREGERERGREGERERGREGERERGREGERERGREGERERGREGERERGREGERERGREGERERGRERGQQETMLYNVTMYPQLNELIFHLLVPRNRLYLCHAIVQHADIVCTSRPPNVCTYVCMFTYNKRR